MHTVIEESINQGVMSSLVLLTHIALLVPWDFNNLLIEGGVSVEVESSTELPYMSKW